MKFSSFLLLCCMSSMISVASAQHHHAGTEMVPTEAFAKLGSSTFPVSCKVSVEAKPGLLSFQSAGPQASAKPSPIDESKEALALSGLKELPGKVPTRYVPGAQSRAAEYQKSSKRHRRGFQASLA